jgi:AcrR family transcriptional regulator
MDGGEMAEVGGVEVSREVAAEVHLRGRRLPNGRHPIPPEQVESHQRARLIAAIASSCATRGYGATTIADIVAGAAVSKTTFYKFFPSKCECLLAAHDELSARLLAAIDLACVEGSGEPEATRAGLRAALNLLAEDLAGAQLLTTAILCAGAAGMARHHALTDALAARLGPPPDTPASRLRPDSGWGAVVILTAAVSRAAALGDPEALLGLEDDFALLLERQT